MYNRVLLDENVFTTESAKGNYEKLPAQIRDAATNDLNALYAVTRISADDFRDAMLYRYPEDAELISLLPCYTTEPYLYSNVGCWGDNAAKIAEYHRHNGTGVFSLSLIHI